MGPRGAQHKPTYGPRLKLTERPAPAAAVAPEAGYRLGLLGRVYTAWTTEMLRSAKAALQ